MSKIRDELVELTVRQATLTARYEHGNDRDIDRDARDAQFEKVAKQVEALVQAAIDYLDITVEDKTIVSETEDNLYAALNEFY